MATQLDMFAVELGAAILLQFETGAGVVRILADAGEAKHNVKAKLANAVDGFTEDHDYQDIHIDLMIGTHYDSDHLAGLVDVINDPNVTIGEAWLPPVANDADPESGRNSPRTQDLLAIQLAGDDAEEVLQRYLRHKAETCVRLEDAEQRSAAAREKFVHLDREAARQFSVALSEAAELSPGPDADRFFEHHLHGAKQTLGVDPGGHGEEEIQDPWNDDEVWYLRYQDFGGRSLSWWGVSSRAAMEAPALALVRRSVAKDAINAKSLAAVVAALKAKKVPICCRIIKDGTPRRFVWKAGEARFIPATQASSDGPELVLLGPSVGLVKKHWKRLPIGDYAMKIAYQALPVEKITASNQLSYILRVDFEGARILVTGDAGCVDFKPSARAEYHPALIAELAPLDVIQVAHHAGHNAHFYNCLLEAKYPAQETASYLLLSHETHDKYRPSTVFADFIAQVRKDGQDVQLLFTSQPSEARSRDFKALFAPVVGAKASSGGVRIRHDKGGWSVTAHAVSAP